MHCTLFNPIIHNRKAASHWISHMASPDGALGFWEVRAGPVLMLESELHSARATTGGVLPPVHACSRWWISFTGLKRIKPRIPVQSRLLQFKYASVNSTTILMRFSQVYYSSKLNNYYSWSVIKVSHSQVHSSVGDVNNKMPEIHYENVKFMDNLPYRPDQ